MKKCVNGVVSDMTDDEAIAMQASGSNVYEGYDYGSLVQLLISEKYSIADEIAINRQREDKVDEFEEYYDFCEACKLKASEILEG